MDSLPMGGRSSDSRSESPFLDAYALSKLMWNDSDASSDEVDHILANTTMVASTAATGEGTDNPDEDEVNGLIDTFEVDLPDRSLVRISSWLANVARPDGFDFINKRKVLSPLPTNRKRKSSSMNLKCQPALKAPKLMIDQPICPACNSTFATKNKLLKHGRKPRTSEACREAINYAFE